MSSINSTQRDSLTLSSRNPFSTKQFGYNSMRETMTSQLYKTGTLFDLPMSDNPAPNSYHTEDYKSCVTTNGKSMSFRSGEEHFNKNPAPSQYYQEDNFTKLSTLSDNSQSIRPRVHGTILEELQRRSVREYKAATGDIGQSSTIQAGGISFKGRGPPEHFNKNPAPNAYAVDGGYRSVSNQAPIYTMKFSERQVFNVHRDKKHEPSVEYSNQDSCLNFNHPSTFSIDGLKDTRKMIPTPGAGHYANVMKGYKKLCKRSPSISFGSRHAFGNHF